MWDVIKDNAPAFGTPSLLKEGEGGVWLLMGRVIAAEAANFLSVEALVGRVRDWDPLPLGEGVF
jgi:hypothetical protein